MVGDRGMIANAVEVVGEPATLDDRATLAVGRARWVLVEPGALDLILRAFVLEARGAGDVLSSYLANTRDVVEVQRIREVLEGAERAAEPSFSLALALAEGRDADARKVLADIARAGDPTAARSLLDIALERKDWQALRTAVEILGSRAPNEARRLIEARDALEQGKGEVTLSELDAVASIDTQAGALASDLRTEAYERWLGQGEESFRGVLGELRRAAGALERLDLVSACEALAVEQKRPLRVAVVGEFNAGKSTFINALLGADVAPTGILPTTASLHWLTWAPDPFARIVTTEGADRIVPHDALKAALDELRASSRPVREVHICAPIERLRRIEVLDTPGFNAPDADHVTAASRAVHEAHVALWVLDATQALKDSERRVLARIADVGTPVQVLVNKCDRLDEVKQRAVVQHVTEGLESIGLPSMSPVVGFSARLALAGRLGDEKAALQSSWHEVEDVLSRTIVDRSDELRARALRRKARDIAVELDGLAGTKTLEPGMREELRGLPAQAAQLLAIDRTGCEKVVNRVEDASARVVDDLRPLRVAGMQADDVHASAYAEARVLARLTGPLALALLEVSGVEVSVEPIVRQAVAAVLRGATAEAHDLERLASMPSWRVVRACATGAHDRLMARFDEAGQEPSENPTWLRLSAVRRALEAMR